MLDTETEALFNRRCRGLVQKIRDSGEGDFIPDKGTIKIPKIAPKQVLMALRYGYKDGHMLRIEHIIRRTAEDKWQLFHYAYTYGDSHKDEHSRIFAVDLDEVDSHHLHIPMLFLTEKMRHIPADSVFPNTVNLGAHDFVDYVQRYRAKIASGASPRDALPFYITRPL